MTGLSAVTPAIQGNHWLNRDLRMRYTIGPHNAAYTTATFERIMNGGIAAIDIETYGLGANARQIKCVTFANEDQALILDPRDGPQALLIETMIRTLSTLIFHNSAFDVPNLVLNRLMTVPDCDKVVDTLLYARLAEPDILVKRTLEACAERYLSFSQSRISMKDIFRSLGYKISEGWKRLDLDFPIFIHGAAMDTITTYRLLKPIRDAAWVRLQDHPFDAIRLGRGQLVELMDREQVINRLFLRRSARGIRIDPSYLAQYRSQQEVEREQAIQMLAGASIEPHKAQQLTTWLDGCGALPADHPRTPTGKPSTTAKHLDQLRHPMAQAYKRVKQIDHVIKDYLEKCDELAIAGRVHPEVNLLAATTGRMSMGNPPFQQFSGDARGIVLADEGEQLTSIDWSQIEPVLAANLSQEHKALAEYESGGDFYDGIASRAGITRKQAKVVLLAQLYGEGIAKLAADLEISRDEAYALRNSIFDDLPEVSKFIGRTKYWANKSGITMTLSGRVVPIPAYQGSIAAYKAVNYRVQGGAYDLMAEALIKIESAGLGDHIYLAMHDEIVCSTEVADDVRKIMEDPPERMVELSKRTPVLRTDMHHMGGRWAEV